jgi:hypothetical protein
MKRVIFKYELSIDPSQHILIPSGAKILCVQMQGTTPCVWAEFAADAQEVSREFHLYATGQLADISGEYVGTFQDGPFVEHLFVMPEETR